ncbi:MAG: NAD(P)H-binding protein, partial [Actinomycetota bacterium]
MRIVVFGATGRVGRAVVEQGLARGHEITAFVRSPEKLDRCEAPGLTVVIGDASDASSAAAGIPGHDAVISALGVVGLGETTALSEMTANVVAGAKAHGVRRVVGVVSVAVFFKTSRPPFQFVGEEHRRDLATLRASGLDWVGAAPGTITDDEAVGTYEAVLNARAPGEEITRFDLADFLLDAAQTDAFVGHVVGLSS